MLSVLLCDDHPLFRRGLRTTLQDAGMAIAGEADDGAAAVELARALAPDVIVMDLRMPGCSGIEATRAIVAEHPGAAILVVTMHEDDESVFAAMRAGARGYVLKGASHDEIVRAVEGVAAGDAIFGPGIAARVLALFAQSAVGPAPAFPELTTRERQILELMARGEPNARIAEQLFLSQKTVRNYASNIFTKLHVVDRTQAVARARDAGLGGAPG